MKRTRFALVACIAFTSTSASLAQAQTAPAPDTVAQPEAEGNATEARALAETLFFTARGLMEAGRYTQACDKLAESYRLDAAAGTLLNLAVCNQKIGKIASAWGEFRDAASEAKRMQRPDREKLATESYEALQPDLPFLAITVPAHVRTIRGLVIARNGVPLTSAAWDTELPVDPGRVEVTERAPGYKPKTLFVNVGKKEHGTLTVVPLDIAPIEKPPQPFWTGRRSLGALLMGAGVAAGVGGAIFGLQAQKQWKDSNGQCSTFANDGGLHCNSSGASDARNANTSAWLSNVGFGLAAVGILTGAYFFIWANPSQERPVPTAAWSWTVNGGPRGASGLLTHSF